MDNKLKKFMQESGFKILAVADLTAVEYSISLYLINCFISGLEQIITNTSELSSLIGYTEDSLRIGIRSLEDRNMIEIRKREQVSSFLQSSIALSFQFDVDLWKLIRKNQPTTLDAVIYPFVRGQSKLSLTKAPERSETKVIPDWQQILNAYGRSQGEESFAQEKASALILAETHVIDTVLLLVRHFQKRIQTLSLLASSWEHYLELYEEETQKIDFVEARRKHSELDDKLREKASEWLKKAKEKRLTQEERDVMELLLRHQHPRRQLYWAYQTRSRYNNLAEFFKDSFTLMLPITSSGLIVKRQP